ncbi:MAG TPA: recombinase family protein [Miltoncostaeaceae bacterium]|nr:recombinase family protein [Miltoncostaeaceae bacterium]
MTKLVGYVRIGPRERDDERPSLDIQRRGLENAAQAKGWELVRVEEDVRSGRSLRRPGLRAALAACRAGEAEGIAVARLDRLTYSITDLAELVREAVEGGYTIVSLQPSVDIASDGGRVVGEVLAEAATWQPRAIATAGRALTGRPGRPSSTPAAVAERIRDLRARGMTLQAICDTLNRDGIPTPRGGAEWRPTSLRSVLRA